MVEQHTLGYLENSIYLNGNRVSDQFLLRGPDGTAPCLDINNLCTTTYRYGPRENLIQEARTRSGGTQTTCYRLDPAMNVTDVWEIPCQPIPPPAPQHFVFDGTRLIEEHNEQGLQRRFFYDTDGNLDCVTSASGSSSDCRAPYGASVPGPLKEVYEWDYLNRLESFQRFSGGTRTLNSDYEHDPLNRLVREDETHTPGASRTTCSLYLGLSTEASEEKHFSLGPRDQPTPQTTKTYSHGSGDERLSMTKVGGPDAGEHFYARNVHTDVSLLLRSDGTSRASYVYKPYGGEDGLSRDDLESPDPLNAYRFNDKRNDSGSGTLDAGARRYATGILRFVQRDEFYSAAIDHSLDTDLLLQNRYSFAGANPVTWVELDGHEVGYDTSDLNPMERRYCKAEDVSGPPSYRLLMKTRRLAQCREVDEHRKDAKARTFELWRGGTWGPPELDKIQDGMSRSMGRAMLFVIATGCALSVPITTKTLQLVSAGATNTDRHFLWRRADVSTHVGREPWISITTASGLRSGER